MAGSFYTKIRDHKTLCKAFTLIDENDTTNLIFAGATKSSYFGNKTSAEDCISICKNAGKEKQLIFLEHLNPIADFYGAIDLYVHSSKHDTFGLAPMEACFNNLPVILSDLAVFKEIYAHYPQLDYFTVANHKELAALINQHINQDGKPRNAVINKRFTQNYTIEKYLSALSEVYHN
jgi:glycosyltransferase involved in cell wall biosynthesis